MNYIVKSKQHLKASIGLVVAVAIIGAAPMQIVHAADTSSSQTELDAKLAKLPAYLNNSRLGYYHAGDTVTYDLDDQITKGRQKPLPVTYSNLHIKTDEIPAQGPGQLNNGDVTSDGKKPVYGSVAFVTLPNGHKGIKYTAVSYDPLNKNSVNKGDVYDTIDVDTTDANGNPTFHEHLTVKVVAPNKNVPLELPDGVSSVTRGSTPAQPNPAIAYPAGAKLKAASTDSDVVVGQPTTTTVVINNPSQTKVVLSLDLQIYNSQDSQILSMNYPEQSLQQGNNTYVIRWTPKTAGIYKFAIPGFDSDSQDYYSSKIYVKSSDTSTRPTETPESTPAIDDNDFYFSSPSTTATTNQPVNTIVKFYSPIALTNASINLYVSTGNEDSFANQYLTVDVKKGLNEYSLPWTPPHAGIYEISANFYKNTPAKEYFKLHSSRDSLVTVTDAGSSPSSNQPVVTIASEPLTVNTGQPVTSVVNVNSSTALKEAVVDIQILDADNRVVNRTYYSHNNLLAGKNSFNVSLPITKPGKYTVRAGVYTFNWQSNLVWNNAAGIITILDQASSTSSKANSTVPVVAAPAPVVTPTAVKQTQVTPVTSTEVKAVTTPAITNQPAVVTVAADSMTTSNGQKITSPVDVTSSAMLSNALIDIETFDSNNQRVNQTIYEGKDLKAGKNSFSASWTPTKAGKYTVKAGVFTANWQKNLTWNGNAATISVEDTTTTAVKPAPTTPAQLVVTPTPVSTTAITTAPVTSKPVTVKPIPVTQSLAVTSNLNNATLQSDVNLWWPSNGSSVSGTQPFKAVIDGRSLDSYKLYWQVDGGAISELINTDGNHKESLVNLSGWNWHSDHKYKLTFIAKDMSGNIIASKDTVISVY